MSPGSLLVGAAWPVFAGLSYADLGFTGRVLADGRPATAGAAR